MRSVARRRARHDPQQPLSEHIDKPLRRHVWASKNRTWTRAQLARERADFFDTRVTGRPEIWQTLHAALEILWEADAAAASRTAAPAPVAPADDNESREPDDDADDADEDTALATAQSILKAAEITLPTGNLSNGVYDALGTYYALPEWIVCDPVNVAEGSEEQVDDDRSRAAKEVGEDGEDPAAEEGVENVLNEDEDEALRRREEKGKAVADVRDLVKLRARLSENSRDIIVSVGSNETARSVARKITDEANVSSARTARHPLRVRVADTDFPSCHPISASNSPTWAKFLRRPRRSRIKGGHRVMLSTRWSFRGYDVLARVRTCSVPAPSPRAQRKKSDDPSVSPDVLHARLRTHLPCRNAH